MSCSFTVSMATHIRRGQLEKVFFARGARKRTIGSKCLVGWGQRRIRGAEGDLQCNFWPVKTRYKPNFLWDGVFLSRSQWQPKKEVENKTGGYWPEWLAEDHAELTVWSIGYKAASSGWRGTAMPLFDRANHVLAELKAGGLGQRP